LCGRLKTQFQRSLAIVVCRFPSGDDQLTCEFFGLPLTMKHILIEYTYLQDIRENILRSVLLRSKSWLKVLAIIPLILFSILSKKYTCVRIKKMPLCFCL